MDGNGNGNENERGQATDTPVIHARGVSVVRGGRRIIDDLSVRVPPESTTLVQGKSGAGKTTLFDVLGLLTTPTDGVLEVDGTDVARLPERKRAGVRRETIGFVFQDFQLIDDLSARENARLPQEHAGSVDEAWLDTLFDRLGLDGVADASPRTLSGGEKQRVAIARALANRPAVVLADEPTGQLDPETTEAVLDLLLTMHAEAATALVVISHDPRLAGRFDRTLVLDGGTLSAPDDRES